MRAAATFRSTTTCRKRVSAVFFEQVHPVAIVYAEGNRKQAEPLADCAPLISMDEGFAAPADADLLQSIRESVLDY